MKNVSFQRLLSICPVLEDLLVDGYEVNGLRKIIVVVPSLLRLVLSIPDKLYEFVMNTPSLKYLKLEYLNSKSHHCLIEKMPKLREAYIDASFPYMERLVGSITSVKRLALCLLPDSLEVIRFLFFLSIASLQTLR